MLHHIHFVHMYFILVLWTRFSNNKAYEYSLFRQLTHRSRLFELSFNVIPRTVFTVYNLYQSKKYLYFDVLCLMKHRDTLAA